MTRTAVLTIAHGRHDHLALQHRSLARSTRPPDLYVVAAMGDPAIVPETVEGLHRDVVAVRATGPLPLAAARNAAAATALDAGAETLVLLDVDCLAAPELVGAYADVVAAAPESVWSGPVTYLPPAPPGGYRLTDLAHLDDPHPARPAPDPGEVRAGAAPELFWSLSFALSAAAWRRTGGFHEEYVGYGGEDTDFARIVLQEELGLGWVGAARAYHQHHPTEKPPVRHLDDILRNGRIYHRRWGCWPMLGWLQAFEERGLIARSGDSWVRTPRPPVATAGADPSLPQVAEPSPTPPPLEREQP